MKKQDRINLFDKCIHLLHKLSSIPESNSPTEKESLNETEPKPNDEIEKKEEATKPDVPDTVTTSETPAVLNEEEKIENNNLQPISKDPRYAKYFKMVQFGVPPTAVKLKMKQEGLDPMMLDNPGQMVPITELVVDTNTTTDEDDD